LKKDGYAEETIKGYAKRLNHLDRNTDIDKPELVKASTPRKKISEIARLAVLTDYMKDLEFTGSAKILETIMEKFNETRTIKIKDKNVDDLDMENSSLDSAS